MSNPLIGELEIEILDQKFTLRPTFEGLIEAETRSGSSIAQLANKIMLSIAGIRDYTAIIYGGVYGYNDNKVPSITFNELGNMIMKHGFPNLAHACGQFMGAAISGNPIKDIDTSVLDSKKKKVIDQEQASYQ